MEDDNKQNYTRWRLSTGKFIFIIKVALGELWFNYNFIITFKFSLNVFTEFAKSMTLVFQK